MVVKVDTGYVLGGGITLFSVCVGRGGNNSMCVKYLPSNHLLTNPDSYKPPCTLGEAPTQSGETLTLC